MLVKQKCSSGGKLSLVSILISLFSLLNGILGLVRINVAYPIYEVNNNFGLVGYMIVYCTEKCFFFGAVWFFSLNYYKVASELKILLS